MLIPKNILVILVLVIIAFVLYVYSCNHPKDIDPNKKAVEILQEQIRELQSEQIQLKQTDSIIQARFEQRLKSDSIQLSTLKKRRDEKNIRIDNSDNNELRRILAED